MFVLAVLLLEDEEMSPACDVWVSARAMAQGLLNIYTYENDKCVECKVSFIRQLMF